MSASDSQASDDTFKSTPTQDFSIQYKTDRRYNYGAQEFQMSSKRGGLGEQAPPPDMLVSIEKSEQER